MKIIKQGSYINYVRRIDENTLESGAMLVSTDFEGSASLFFVPETYEVKDAVWGIHHAKDPERRGEGRATMLIGESCYATDRNSIKIMPDYSKSVDYSVPPGGWEGAATNKSQLVEAIADDDKERAVAEKANVSPEWENIRELFLEAVRGAYQAEFYLLEEREFGSLLNYEINWIATKDNDYCRPYHNTKPEVNEWPEHTGAVEHYRRKDLYNKYISHVLMDRGGDQIEAFGSFHDSFHEMSVLFHYGKEDGIITDLEVDIVRVPMKACWGLQDVDYASHFVGRNVYELKKRDVGKAMGKGPGCFHLVDVMYDIILNIV